MGIEIERKFLVQNEEWRSLAVSSSRIIQGYIANTDKASVRVRKSDLGAWITVKSPSPSLTRSEFEVTIPTEDAEEMLESMCGSILQKVRYLLSSAPHVWTIDVFEGRNTGLTLLEVESDGPFELHDVPAWVGKDVTGDARYSNALLSIQPFEDWPGHATGQI